MASDKNVILLLTDCKKSDILEAQSANINTIKEKGVILSNVNAKEDYKTMVTTGKGKETIWDAAKKENLIVGGLKEQFDLCVINLPAAAAAIETELTAILEIVERKTLVVLIAQNCVIFYGTGVAKAKVIDAEICACSIVPTTCYIANLPMPEDCVGTILFSVLKDLNMKFKEVKKLQTTVINMEAAMERKARQPWDKHDCA